VGSGAVYRGQEKIKAWVRDNFTCTPDLKIEVQSLFVAGDWAGAEWIQSGTYTGEVAGVEVTGKHFSGRGASIIELREGKIRREAMYWDELSFLRQLGVMAEASSG